MHETAEIEMVLAYAIENRSGLLTTAEAGALQDIWTGIKNKTASGFKSAVAALKRQAQVFKHIQFTAQGIKAQNKETMRLLRKKLFWFGALATVGGLLLRQAQSSPGLRKAGAVAAVAGILVTISEIHEADMRLCATAEKELDANIKKELEKSKAKQQKLAVQLQKAETVQASVIAGISVKLIGSGKAVASVHAAFTTGA